MQTNTLPLWRLMQATAQVVLAVNNGRSGTAALEALPSPERPGAQALSFQVWRNLGRAQALRQQLAPRKPPAAVDALLCTALALAWDAEQAPYDAFTLVDQTVEAAKRQPALARQAGFVNACLRRFLREQAALVEATDSQPVSLWNHPAWWIARLQKDYPQQWQRILQANNAHAPMTLRVNARKATLPAYRQALRAQGIAAEQSGRHALTLQQAVPVQKLPGWNEGAVSVQDAAAQLAAEMLAEHLQNVERPRILDACAAPGGKTGHLLELMDADVLALDQDAARARRITESLARLQLQATVRAADASQPASWWDGKPFDAVLLDAPCTASGIVRRHPDVRWLRREDDIAQLAGQQRALLQALWPLVRQGGFLLYCTCSVFPAEGRLQIETFLAHNSDARLEPSPGHLMPQSALNPAPLPDNPCREHDGFFYALLQKR